MKPRRIVFFLSIVFSISIGIALIFPVNGIQVHENLTLKFAFRLNDLKNKSPEYADITSILSENETFEFDSTLLDSLPKIKAEIKIDTIRASAKSLKAKVQKIEYPSGDSTILFAFFQKLDNARGKRVRIMHYGDSQIEGDRITGYLRNRFQRRFGGSGPGLMTALPGHAESASIIHKASNNWIQHSVYYKKDTILPHRKFGVLGSFARFTSYQADSINSNTVQQAWIEFNKSGMAYSSVRNFTECRVFYGHVNKEFTVKGFINDSLTWFEYIDPAQSIKSFKWQFTAPPSRFRVEFEGSKSPDIYAISLDSPKGVSVDNLPFRGSSGTEFNRLDFKHVEQMSRNINSGLIIMQFGVNVVPHIVKNYNWYERALTRQLKYMKQVFPYTPILIVSVSDMSMRKGNYYVTYPNIKKIKRAQRNAAKNANCSYWDLQQAMGGENSMPSWVFAQPTLASKDFIHFNRRGGHIIAQMLFNALMYEYDNYKKLSSPDANRTAQNN